MLLYVTRIRSHDWEPDGGGTIGIALFFAMRIRNMTTTAPMVAVTIIITVRVR